MFIKAVKAGFKLAAIADYWIMRKRCTNDT
jgi:hypothetical protein